MRSTNSRLGFPLSRVAAVALVLCLLTVSTPAAPRTVLSLATASYYSFLFWFHASRLPRLLQGRSLDSQRKQEKQADRNLKVSRIRISPENATVDLSDH